MSEFGLNKEKENYIGEIKAKKVSGIHLGMVLLKMRTMIALILLIIVFSMLDQNFLTTQNLIILTTQVVLWAVLGIGMTYVIVTGGIDLSVGSVVGLSGMVSGILIYKGLILPMFGVKIYFDVFTIILITLGVGCVVGAVNGILITRFKVAPFIATLGMLYVAQGFALLSSNGNTYSNLYGIAQYGNTGFPNLGSGTFLGLPIPIWIMIVLGVISAYVFRKTPLGLHTYAVGGNEKAAQLSGIRVNRVKMFAYIFSGFCAAMVGLIITSQLVASDPSTGNGWELNAIAAAVLGGTSLMGGKGSIGGTIVGAFVIGVLSDGMIMMGISEFWQMIITGSVIVLAIIIEQLQGNLQRKLEL